MDSRKSKNQQNRPNRADEQTSASQQSNRPNQRDSQRQKDRR